MSFSSHHGDHGIDVVEGGVRFVFGDEVGALLGVSPLVTHHFVEKEGAFEMVGKESEISSCSL